MNCLSSSFIASIFADFQVQKGIPINILAFIPAVILGIIGGFLGALFTFVNLKIVKARRRILASLRHKWKRYIVKIGEPILIMVNPATYITVIFLCTLLKTSVCMSTITDACRHLVYTINSYLVLDRSTFGKWRVLKLKRSCSRSNGDVIYFLVS